MKIKAHVPTQQYGFIEITGEPEDQAEIERLYNQYAEQPINFSISRTSSSDHRKLLKAFSGGEVFYDEQAHVYTNEAGEVYLSGSVYADSFRKPFDKQKIAEMMASKIEGTAEDIIKMWELKGESSRDFGNAIHKALQLYEQYDGLAASLNKTTNSHDHPVIKHAVDSFMEAHKGERVISEALVVNHEAKHAGQIDRLLILGRKRCVVTDFKTNASLDKDIEIYWKQLEFYGDILTANGWTVEGYKIYHYDGSWKEYTHERITDSQDTKVA